MEAAQEGTCMKISLVHANILSAKANLLVIGMLEDKVQENPYVRSIDKKMRGQLMKLVEKKHFKGKREQVLVLPTFGRIASDRIALVGMGKRVDEKSARYLGVRAGRLAIEEASLLIQAPCPDQDELRGLADGVTTGAYAYEVYLTNKKKRTRRISKVSIHIDQTPTAEQKFACAQGQAIGECVNFARDLVNCPPNDMYPQRLADSAVQASKALPIKCTVLDKSQIEKAGMNLLLAVNRGSDRPPRFIHMSYQPKGANKKVVLVGKGLTFDAGGLCLKPSQAMADMKCDMAGGAVTIATVIAVARLGLPVEVHGIVPSTENMTGGSAFRPGDIFKSLDGKTVEIVNTDAEGRLILADALAYARELKPDFLIDHATLTGACMVALGKWTAGLYSDHKDLAKAYRKSADRTGESFWQLPLNKDLKSVLKSALADLKHCGEPYGGSISAALFLQEFVGKTPWIHLDIAGPAHLPRPHKDMPKGGTGFGVLTAVDFIRNLASSQ